MLSVKNFVFNPFMENTLVVYDETLEAAIVDCGCLYDTERRELKKFIDDNRLKVKYLLNTHLHLDHQFGNATLSVISVPGHSAGSVCFYCAQDGILIAGDVLFAGSIGRTDLPGGDFDLLTSGIRQKLFTLPPDTKVYPGHGPTTTIGREIESNPFF